MECSRSYVYNGFVTAGPPLWPSGVTKTMVWWPPPPAVAVWRYKNNGFVLSVPGPDRSRFRTIP